MVIQLFFWLLLLPSVLFSGEFTSSVNRNQIGINDNLTLTLTLKDASAQGTPSIDSLRASFYINSQQQSSNITVLNGRVSSNISWLINLTPNSEGETIIPQISIATSEGVLFTKPIAIKISKASSADSASSEISEITLKTSVSKSTPYKNEPIFLTVKLASKVELANIAIQKFNIEDAIVEPSGEPQIYKKIVDGIRVDEIEYNYLITPLKSGPLKIPPIVIQGMISTRKKSTFGSFLDDDFQSFFMPNINQLKAITLVAKEVDLEVQPPIPGMTPWLPAISLKIEEIWNESQTFQVGEPLTRGFRIIAEGILSSQLPSLQSIQIADDPNFKIYADKPETGEEIEETDIRSFRNEQYTLIPQQSGDFILPEITIAWWDTVNKQKAFARLPSRSLKILPAVASVEGTIASLEAEKLIAQEPSQTIIQEIPTFLYVLIAALAVFLSITIFWMIALQKKIVRLTEKPSNMKVKEPKPRQEKLSDVKVKPKNKDKSEKLPDLNPT